MLEGIEIHIEATKGMSNEDIWAWNGCVGEEGMQFFDDLLAGARQGTGVTPAVACTVISADASKGSNLWLYKTPDIGEVPKACIHNDGGTSFAHRRDMQAVASDIDKRTA